MKLIFNYCFLDGGMRMTSRYSLYVEVIEFDIILIIFQNLKFIWNFFKIKIFFCIILSGLGQLGVPKYYNSFNFLINE